MKRVTVSIITAFLAVFLCLSIAFAGSQTTSTSTAATLITQVRAYLNESAASFWTDAELLQWLNDGTLDIATRTNAIETSEVKTLGLANSTYPLTSSFISVKNVVYKSYNEKVTNGTMEANSSWTDQGTPTTNERSSTQIYFGSYSWKFTVNAADEGIKNSTFTTVSGTTYYYMLWVYPDDSTSVNVYIYNGAGTGASVDVDHTGLTQDAWNAISGSWTEAGAGGSSAYLAVRSPTGTAAGSWYIDDASIFSTGYTKSLRRGNIEHIGDTKDIGEPAYWTTWGNNLIVYPSPDSEASGKTVTAYLVSRPAALASTTSTVLVPAQYDKALVLYMVAQGLWKDDKSARAAQIMGQYYAELDRFRADTVEQKPLENVK